MVGDDFSRKFHELCQMDFIPDIDISYIKHVKMNFIDVI